MTQPKSLAEIEGLREKILTLGICIGPYDSPHRCSALHCSHCGLCDVSEDLIQLINSLIAAHEKEVLESIMARVVELTILDKNMSFEQLSFLYERVLQDRLASLEGKE